VFLKVFFKQIKTRGDNFSYIIADEEAGETVVVDPSFNSSVILKIMKEKNWKVKYVINTHSHWDHVAGNRDIIRGFKAKIVAHKLSSLKGVVRVVDGDTLKVGKTVIRIIHTPGHSPDSICLLVDGLLLTGDTLFIGGCGRTDFPGGSSTDLYDSLFNKLMKLDDDLKVYPGHDYGVTPHSTIKREKKTNYVLKKRSLQQFIDFMGEA
jgi:hydroxyacylglutathione hydrolase